MSWARCVGLSQSAHRISALEADWLLESQQLSTGARFDRAAGSGNSPLTNTGYSAPSDQFSQPSQRCHNSNIFSSGKWQVKEKAEKKRQKVLQNRCEESHTEKQKSVECILQKAETPTSIRTRCQSNKCSWQTEHWKKKNVCFNERIGREKNKMWKERETFKEQKPCKKQESGIGAICLPHLQKSEGTSQGNSKWQRLLGNSAPDRPPEGALQVRQLAALPQEPADNPAGRKECHWSAHSWFPLLARCCTCQARFEASHLKFVIWTV